MADSRRAWAKALYEGLGDATARKEASLALDEAAKALDDYRVEAFFMEPAIGRAAKAEMLVGLLPDSAAPGTRTIYSRFVGLVIERNRVGLLPGIATVFRSFLDEDLGLVRLQVTSARPLAPAILAKLEAAWKQASGAREVLLSSGQDPALMGGFILRAGTVRYDWSTLGRLRRLDRELSRPLTEGGSERG